MLNALFNNISKHIFCDSNSFCWISYLNTLNSLQTFLKRRKICYLHTKSRTCVNLQKHWSGSFINRNIYRHITKIGNKLTFRSNHQDVIPIRNFETFNWSNSRNFFYNFIFVRSVSRLPFCYIDSNSNSSKM